MERENNFKQNRILTNIGCESTGEYVLPDYKGDVKKILLTKVNAVPSGKFPGQDRVELVGKVLYSIVYIDGENQLTSVDFDTDYQLEVRCDDEKFVDAIGVTRVGGYSVRLMGPRKFSVKASLVSDVGITEAASINLEGDAFEREDVECLGEKVTVGASVIGEVRNKEYRETIAEIEGAIEEEIELLLLNTEPRVSSVNCFDGEAEVTGDVAVTALISRNGEMPYTSCVKIPISERVEMDGIREGAEAMGHMYIGSAKSQIESSDEGVTLFITLSVDVEVFATEQRDMEVCLDAYTCSSECEVEYGTLNYSTPPFPISTLENLSYEIPFNECSVENLRNVVYSVGAVVADECAVEDGAPVVRGKVRLSGIACEINEDGSVGYSPLKLDLPFDINVNKTCQFTDNARLICSVVPKDISVTNDSEKLYVTLSLDITGAIYDNASAVCVKSCKVSSPLKNRDKSELVVYYPDTEDSLFDIAKRYHTTVMKIASANSLTESVFNAKGTKGCLGGIKKLIIK